MIRPNQVMVGKTYVGKRGKPRTVTQIANGEIHYTIDNVRGGKFHRSCWGRTFYGWAQKVR